MPEWWDMPWRKARRWVLFISIHLQNPTYRSRVVVTPPNANTLSDWKWTCHVSWPGSKLTYSLARTNLTNSLGKQQLELWTCTWSGRAPWRRGKFVSQPALAIYFFAVVFLFLNWENKTLKPGSHLWDKHNTSEISIGASTRKKERFFFLCLFH